MSSPLRRIKGGEELKVSGGLLKNLSVLRGKRKIKGGSGKDCHEI